MARFERGSRSVVGAAALSLAATALFASGCGGSDEPDAALENSPAPPTGTLIETKATIRGGEPYTNLASAQNRQRGTGEALIVAVVAVEKGSPQLRLTVDGNPIRSTTQSFRSVETVAASEQLPIGDVEVALEGRSSSDSSVKTRSLVVFTPAAADKLDGGDLVNAASIEQGLAGIVPTGSGMGSVQLASDADQLLLMAAYRSPDESSSSPEALRTEALLNGEAIDEIATATMPQGKLAIYYSGDPASAGDEIDLVGFTVAGRASIHAATLAVCPCGTD